MKNPVRNARRASRRANPAALAGSSGHARRPRRDADRVLWENDDWLVTVNGMRSRWFAPWNIPTAKLLRLRDLAAANLPHDIEIERVPFLSALQAALAVHHRDADSICELLEQRARKSVTLAMRANSANDTRTRHA